MAKDFSQGLRIWARVQTGLWDQERGTRILKAPLAQKAIEIIVGGIAGEAGK